jgi:hypothetical protein
LGAGENVKTKTSTPLMFLKGFGPDQCEKDVAKQPSSGNNQLRKLT